MRINKQINSLCIAVLLMGGTSALAQQAHMFNLIEGAYEIIEKTYNELITPRINDPINGLSFKSLKVGNPIDFDRSPIHFRESAGLPPASTGKYIDCAWTVSDPIVNCRMGESTRDADLGTAFGRKVQNIQIAAALEKYPSKEYAQNEVKKLDPASGLLTTRASRSMDMGKGRVVGLTIEIPLDQDVLEAAKEHFTREMGEISKFEVRDRKSPNMIPVDPACPMQLKNLDRKPKSSWTPSDKRTFDRCKVLAEWGTLFNQGETKELQYSWSNAGNMVVLVAQEGRTSQLSITLTHEHYLSVFRQYNKVFSERIDRLISDKKSKEKKDF